MTAGRDRRFERVDGVGIEIRKSFMAKCIVVYDDNCGLCVPLGFDSDCEGALNCSEPVALFEDSNAARKAITISVRFAELQKAQGTIPNTDFLLPARKHIRLVAVATEPKTKRKQ